MEMYILPNTNNKACVVIDGGRRTLFSYDTPVLYTEKGEIHRIWSGWSLTTGRHIKEFCGLTKKEWDKLDVEL